MTNEYATTRIPVDAHDIEQYCLAQTAERNPLKLVLDGSYFIYNILEACFDQERSFCWLIHSLDNTNRYSSKASTAFEVGKEVA
jgi:hypothetical protein